MEKVFQDMIPKMIYSSFHSTKNKKLMKVSDKQVMALSECWCVYITCLSLHVLLFLAL